MTNAMMLFFYQISQLDTVAIYNESKQSLLSEYTQEQLDNPTEEISAAIQTNISRK